MTMEELAKAKRAINAVLVPATPDLTMLELPLLEEVERLYIDGNGSLKRISLPRLRSARAGEKLQQRITGSRFICPRLRRPARYGSKATIRFSPRIQLPALTEAALFVSVNATQNRNLGSEACIVHQLSIGVNAGLNFMIEGPRLPERLRGLTRTFF